MKKEVFPIEFVITALEQEVVDYAVPVVDLIAAQTKDPLKVLLATILSARTKDEVTAAAAKRLFAKADSLEALERLSLEELEKIIYPVGFFRNKAKYLANLPEVMKREFNGRIPDTVDELVKLPGVGRKTANLVVAVAFNKPAICVDTHVHRIMNLWGYVETTTPLQTEMALRAKLPEKYWITINSLLVAFGQGICKPRAPHCDRCVIAEDCPQLGVTPRKIPGAKRVSSGSKFVSWNVNGLRAALKKDKGFLDVLHELDADIFAVQEIKAMPDQLPDEVKNIPGYTAYWYPAQKKGYSGTAVFTRKTPKNVMYGLGKEAFDREGRVLTLEFDDFYFITAYFPNSQHGLKRLQYKQDFNMEILHYMNQLAKKKSVVLCGDLNVAHKEIDLANPKTNVKNPGFCPEERAWMDEVIRAGYVDTFRLFNQEPEQYTWWSYRFHARARNIGWRIDYFVVDPASRDRVCSAAIHDDVLGSDHCPVSIEFT
ncbi:exodeoxyribonuclease III [Desulfobulbus sp. US1]|nr:exodeoxyribonuclease III [Desulfobulbus sp. US4]MCW5208844.1 exodeoxyribonuclease III [Desulfobulbus sp. US1]MCW5213792.1 exodeoxyribonuclease III [Desulfobulbus sp. US5]